MHLIRDDNMNREIQEIKKLFRELRKQDKQPFPKKSKTLYAPREHGVYIIHKQIRGRETILHVGRTLRGRNGIYQRLKNHLGGASSFTKKTLNGKGSTLRRNGHTYQCLVIKHPRKRALLEAYAIGTLCPKHLGLGE